MQAKLTHSWPDKEGTRYRADYFNEDGGELPFHRMIIARESISAEGVRRVAEMEYQRFGPPTIVISGLLNPDGDRWALI